jgi:hypothetical protein
MHKVIIEISAVDLKTCYEKANRAGAVLRQAADLINVKIPATKLDLRKNFFSVRICKKWNNLPSETKNSANAKSFKANYLQETYGN